MKTNSAQDLIIEGISISHPDSIIYPVAGITKGEVASYYSQISNYMLPYLKDRLISSVRCPKGVGDSCFYRKHPGRPSDGVGSIQVEEEEGTKAEYFYIENEKGLLTEAQMYTLEFHIWGSHVKTLENPDMVVFDFDPDEGLGLEQVRQGVRDLKSLLDKLSLRTFLKTTGGKGYHLVIPINPSSSWSRVSGLAKQIAETMESTWPKLYTTNSRKEKRRGRIYIDWMRNVRGATSVAPYSLRDKDTATVSMPIAWEELDNIAPDGICMGGVKQQLSKGNPWEGYFDVRQEF